MNNHMYMIPGNMPYDQTLNYNPNDSRLWGGFGWGRPWGWGFGRPFFGVPFGFGFGVPFGFGAPFGFGFGFPFFV